MLKPKKVKPTIRINRFLNHDVDMGNEGSVLVETPTAKLVFVQGHTSNAPDEQYVPAHLVVVRPSGKIITMARKGRFDMARFAKLLPKISDQLKADVQLSDIDTRKRDFTTVFEEA